MPASIVDSAEGLTLLGGGELGPRDLTEALTLAPDLVAADSGAAAALARGLTPRAVIGDMDSLSRADQARLGPGLLHRIEEQDSTDFDKVLARVAAPFAIGVGFLGLRSDHQLANFNTLVRARAMPVLLAGVHDVVLPAPPELEMPLAPGTRVSLFPLARVTGRSEGLHWPIDGLAFAPDAVHGTSNRMAAAKLHLAFDAPGMLVILPRAALTPAVAALRGAPRWEASPPPAGPAPAPAR